MDIGKPVFDYLRYGLAFKVLLAVSTIQPYSNMTSYLWGQLSILLHIHVMCCHHRGLLSRTFTADVTVLRRYPFTQALGCVDRLALTS